MEIDIRRQKSNVRLDKPPGPREILPHANRNNTMWPVMTLTLLLQLTDDEQLYAQQEEGKEVKTEAQAPARTSEEAPAAEWPAEAEAEA